MIYDTGSQPTNQPTTTTANHHHPTPRSLEEALVHAFVEARRASPALLFLPHLPLWWATAPAPLRAALLMLLEELPPDLPLLLVAVADAPAEELDPEVRGLLLCTRHPFMRAVTIGSVSCRHTLDNT
jgi:hypothetical protein